jgi:hypothetical protein
MMNKLPSALLHGKSGQRVICAALLLTSAGGAVPGRGPGADQPYPRV